MKWRFALRFLAAFTVLVVAWSATDFGEHYRSLVLPVAQWLSPAANGWQLSYDARSAVFARPGGASLPMVLHLPQLSMFLIPFLSLVAATPGLGWMRLAIAAVAGSCGFFLIHLVILLAYPPIMHEPNAIKDTIGTFFGLLAFVLAPLGMWFAFTYPALRSLWRLGPGTERSSGRNPVPRPSSARSPRVK